uniref:Uncharacterized protein n=1 Tax=Panagrolaimus sp. ES5 TaxID=591445 RepID=A0AC34FS97_9BILA
MDRKKELEKYSASSIYCGFEKHPRINATITTPPQTTITKDASTTTAPTRTTTRNVGSQTTVTGFAKPEKKGKHQEIPKHHENSKHRETPKAPPKQPAKRKLQSEVVIPKTSRYSKLN